MTTTQTGVPRPLTRRPRVLQVVQRYLPELGGLETHVAEVSRRLAATGDFDLTVLATDRTGRLPRAETMAGYQVIRRRSWPRTRDYYASPGVAPVIARGGWDLVHVQGVHTFVPPTAMLAAAAAGVPYLLSFHSGGHSSAARTAGRGLQWRALRPLLGRAQRLIAVSEFERSYFAAATGIPQSRFAVIPNGGALPAVPEGVLPVPGRIVTSGRLERYKGHHRVLEALPHLRRRYPQAHLVILGGGPYEAELRALAARLGVQDAVELRHLPPADRAAMAVQLASASVMAAMSSYEAHPVAVMEAVTMGLPVLGLDAAGIGDLVRAGLVQGVPADAGPELIAAELETVLRQADRGGAAGTGHRPRPTALPSWEGGAQRLAELYHEVLAGARS